jgi:Uncharacterized conserved protein (COG2071)
MLHALKRHPLPIRAYFRHCLVLTYALPRQTLEPLLRPGLALDTHGDLGFVAVAMVQTEALRPAFLPPLFGTAFFLAGYRIFVRFQTTAGKTLRGLQILRSDTDRQLMATAGNLLTHYGYVKSRVRWVETADTLEVAVRTPRAEADLQLVADLSSKPAPLPDGSPFASLQEARRYAGPLPFTFDYERETHSILIVQGVRQQWDPQPVAVCVRENTFLQQAPFAGAKPVLANAFHLAGVPYLWRRGVRERLPGGVR